ncbi:alpha/beta hydrolase, partial [bacterium]|nr:alpha/beta hydrolase [bacterium]
FESTDNVSELTCPVTVLHGTDDRIVPFSLAEKLFAAVPETSASGVPKQFIELPGTGHNDVMYVAEDSYRRAVSAMLQNIRSAD